MARKSRLEAPGAIHHVVSHGIDSRMIFPTGGDRRRFLEELAVTADRYSWDCLSYCLMGTHYHLLIRTREPTLGVGMRTLNGNYVQDHNARVRRSGHLFERRYRSTRVLRQAHLLECFRYLALNPVRAGLCNTAADWPWSAHLALIGKADCRWLAAPLARSYFAEGIAGYRGFVEDLDFHGHAGRDPRPYVPSLVQRYGVLEALEYAKDCDYTTAEFLQAAGLTRGVLRALQRSAGDGTTDRDTKAAAVAATL
jgi:REP element-mobilizing transposase RayT